MTKFLLIGDFEGVSKKLKKNVMNEDFDYILCTGDIVESKDWRKYIFKNWDKLSEGEELEEIIGKKVIKKLEKQDKLRLKEVTGFLRSLKKKMITILGNWDEIVDTSKSKKSLSVVMTKKIKLKNISILAHSGYNAGSNEVSLIKRLKKAAKKVDIFLAHEPPLGVMDKVLFKKSPRYGEHLGIEYYTKYIKKYKPLVMVCGHMHEYQGKRKLGATWVINPGPAAQNKFAILEIVDKKIKVKFFK